MRECENKEAELAKIKKAVQSGFPITITTYTLPHETEIYMGQVLSMFLKEINQEYMTEYLTYCLGELVNNAKKANTKRVYFKEKHLDLNDKNQYKQGMENFKEDTLNNIHYYLKLQEEEGLYVRLIIQKRNNKIRIEVRNNVELSFFEYARIHDKMSRAQQYTSAEQAIKQLLDDSEGAGLGLVIMILMLRKIGLTEENYQVLSENGETITRMILPISKETQKNISMLSSEFVSFIDNLPQFPENISDVNKVLENPMSKMSDIAEKISNDASLTADLLKLVNSASFGRSIRCHSVGDAVKLAGIKGIKNMLFSIGTIKNLASKDETEQKKALWTHAYKAAFYSYNLALNFFGKKKEYSDFVEDSYICGLLHDMGKIGFETVHPETLDKIKEICTQKGLDAGVFEKLIAGVDHCEIGALIAEKWNFPDTITEVIRYHHDPESAPKKIRPLVGLIYLADMTIHYQNYEVTFEQFDSDILKYFGLLDENKFVKLSDMLINAFARRQ